MLKRAFVVMLIGIVALAVAPAQAALAAPPATHAAAAMSPSVTPDGGTGANYCGSIKINGKKTSPNDWSAYGQKVNHSVRVKVSTPPTTETQWCVRQSLAASDCLLAAEGLAFTLLGVGAEVRVVVSVVGGGVISIAGLWESC
jgi:hypothetical protein